MPRHLNASQAIRATATALAVAGLVLGVAGCSKTPEPAPVSVTPNSVEVPVTAPGSTESSTVPGNAKELGYFDATVLSSAMQQWAKGTKGTIVNDQQALRKQLPAAQKWLEGITVVPATCGLYGIGNLQDQLEKSAVAAAVLPATNAGALTVAAYRDRDALVADVAAQQHLDASCGTYSITSDGQKVSYTLSSLDATSSAPFTAATLLESVNGRSKSQQISIRAIDGNVMVSATRIVKKAPEESTALALADVESMLTILRALPEAAPTS
ncbi:hypothetical protein [Paeniglutamicibacter terrestris]|uniref:DUF5642 domain-containing protein n=1 Tax=Paeniglutamicibacter terrestris TaxID=2723403 RepID=A0ABX1G720_9MICC|nr:hypothetical protein [Paeniglutamicibacter terrestris]NKG22068.1 hypothetical protein [Paeniglutamicibacter terrestris]